VRFFEVVVVLLSWVFIIALAIPENRRRGAAPLLFITILLTLLHLFVEGYRWQMLPLYALLGFGAFMKNREAAIGSTFGLHLLWLIALLLPMLIPVVKLPTPTGPFTVGTVVYHWTDSSRAEWFTDELGDLREILVQLWYPSEGSGTAITAPYLDNVDLRGAAIGERVGLPSFMLDHLILVKTYSSENTPPRNGSFPLIIFSHGLGGMRTQNTVLMEELASHGYAVAAMDHPFDANTTVFPTREDGEAPRVADYRSAIPEGTADSVWLEIRNRQLDTRIADVEFTLNQLQSAETPLRNKIDFTRVGIAGHSFGGATAVLTAMVDDRIKAVVALDGWFVPFALSDSETRLDVPFLYMGQERWKAWNEKRHRHYLDLLMEQTGEDAYLLSVKKSRHYDYADIPLFSAIAPSIGLTGFPNGREMVRIVNSTTLRFFDDHVKHVPSRLFPIPDSPHITVRRGGASSS
jgi:predicted dienelactone hydrolase